MLKRAFCGCGKIAVAVCPRQVPGLLCRQPLCCHSIHSTKALPNVFRIVPESVLHHIQFFFLRTPQSKRAKYDIDIPDSEDEEREVSRRPRKGHKSKKKKKKSKKSKKKKKKKHKSREE